MAAGASFPRSARSGDLPPRRVNARVRFRFECIPFQPNTVKKLDSFRQYSGTISDAKRMLALFQKQ